MDQIHTETGVDGMSWGTFFKFLRHEKELTLREFCARHGFDPGNVSKLERGVFPPPQDPKLREYAFALGIEEGSTRWLEFYDLASVGAGKLPRDIASDSSLVQRLPALLRTIRDRRLTREELDTLISRLRNA